MDSVPRRLELPWAGRTANGALCSGDVTVEYTKSLEAQHGRKSIAELLCIWPHHSFGMMHLPVSAQSVR
jgi:hypothetical protein